MDVRLHIYLEGTPSGAVWWSESPDVSGFHATDVRLQDLVRRSELAIWDILDERVLVRPLLIGEPPSSEGDWLTQRDSDDDEPSDENFDVVTSSVSRELAAA